MGAMLEEKDDQHPVLVPHDVSKKSKQTKAPDELRRIDMLMLRMLIDYMANGLVGPFQVIKETPTFWQSSFGGRPTSFRIVGPDFVNRLKLDFTEPEIARDICHALNRTYGFEDLSHWSNRLES